MVREMVAAAPESERAYQSVLIRMRKKLRITPRKAQLLHVYNALKNAGEIEECRTLREVLVTKASKSQSGIISITVLTSPYPRVGDEVQRFSCKWNCHYCPDQPGQPRSYLREEPAVRRANQNLFDPVLQFTDRASVLAQNGHPVDKVELLVLGGTWASYPEAYREEFCRDLFYAANVFFQRPGEGRRMERLSLAEEQRINEGAACKIIGLTLETRPDTIDVGELHRLRHYGCTRVQIGLQHTDDDILRRVNRGHSRRTFERALAALKDSCYKVDVHLMPNLPGATPETDAAMFRDMLFRPELQADQWKIYPTEVTPWTKIKEWYDEGSYVPYDERSLVTVIADCKAKVHPWIRLNRIIRDIPSTYIRGGLEFPNLREAVLHELGTRGERCRCIRCREVGDIGGRGHMGAAKTLKGRKQRDARSTHLAALQLAQSAELTVRTYDASGGVEHFISFETPDERMALCGFVRLRITDSAGSCGKKVAFDELRGAALVRELHVYGQLEASGRREGVEEAAEQIEASAQHMGFGRRLMLHAERMAWRAGRRRVAVISGIGTRNYYRRLGYELADGPGGFMVKELDREPQLFWKDRAKGGAAVKRPREGEERQAGANKRRAPAARGILAAVASWVRGVFGGGGGAAAPAQAPAE